MGHCRVTTTNIEIGLFIKQLYTGMTRRAVDRSGVIHCSANRTLGGVGRRRGATTKRLALTAIRVDIARCTGHALTAGAGGMVVGTLDAGTTVGAVVVRTNGTICTVIARTNDPCTI